MEQQSDCTEQEVEAKHVKAEPFVTGSSESSPPSTTTSSSSSSSSSETAASQCNGFASAPPPPPPPPPVDSDESGRKVGPAGKRKLQDPSPDESGEKKYVKVEDHGGGGVGGGGGGGDIPAHHARRPPNGFLLFCKRHRDIVSAKNPNLENRGVTKLLGNWWRTLEEEERAKYKELARLNKEVFIANNPQFTWYKLPAPPLRTLVTRPSNRRPPKLETSPMNPAGPITPGKLADESQLGGLTNLLSSSVSPPSTPFSASPPSPTSAATTTPAQSAASTTAPAHPKKRFLLQTRAKQQAPDPAHSLSDASDDGSDQPPGKAPAYKGKKAYKKKKNWNAMKYKRNLKVKWSDSFAGKPGIRRDNGDEAAAGENGRTSPNCTRQQLIEKVVDSSFVDAQKSTPPSVDIQRKLDYIHTEHTYQKNPGRLWQQATATTTTTTATRKSSAAKKESCVPLQIVGKVVDGTVVEQTIVSPIVNNNTILIAETADATAAATADMMMLKKKKRRRENGVNEIRYSYNNNDEDADVGGKKDGKLISEYVYSNQRHLDQSSIQTNHDRIYVKGDTHDGYIPDRYARRVREDCDNIKKTVGLEDQNNKPLKKVTQDDVEDEEGGEDEEDDDDDDGDVGDEDEDDDDDIPKNCDRESNFQSILGKVSREIGNMINERSPDSTEEMAVAKFNIQSRSDSDDEDEEEDYEDEDTNESVYDDKSDTASPPESPGGGRRSKRSCKGQRYEQFIKESVSKKRSKNPSGDGCEFKRSRKRRRGDIVNPSSDELEVMGAKGNESDEQQVVVQTKEEPKTTTAPEPPTVNTENHISEDLSLKQGTKASEIIKMKLDKESKVKREAVAGSEEASKPRKKEKETKMKLKKKPMSKVQMIKERRELHIGEFNLNEKIEELPLLSFESFLQKKRQRKKRLLGLKKDGMKNRGGKSKLDKCKGRDSRTDSNAVPNKVSGHGQNSSKPDFADLTTLAETALTLLSLGEPRTLVSEGN